MSLTKTDRKTKEWKEDLFSKIRVAIDQYDYVGLQSPLKSGVRFSLREFRLGLQVYVVLLLWDCVGAVFMCCLGLKLIFRSGCLGSRICGIRT